MAFTRLVRHSAATQLRGALSAYAYSTSQRAGYGSLVPSSDAHKQFFLENELGSTHRQNVSMERTTPYVVHKHGFARIASPPPHLQRQMGLKLYQGSPGTIIDPYHVPSRYPFLKRWFTREGWRQNKEIIMREVKSAYTTAKLRQKGVRRKDFYNDIGNMYIEINKAIAKGDLQALKPLVTENMLSILKNEIKKRENVWDKVHWEIAGTVKVNTLQARMAAIDPKDYDKAFVQVTLMLRSNQLFGAYDRNGKLIAGDPMKKIAVEDIWVFETFYASSPMTFRLCGRITL